MANQFDSIFVKRPRRNKFNLSFQNKLTCKFGQLIPFLVQDVIPGDRFKVGSSHVIRLQPTVTPVMHNVDIYKHYFFVPNRLLWKDWEAFITGGVSGNANPTYPALSPAEISKAIGNKYLQPGSLLDYLGFPTAKSNSRFNLNNPTPWDMLPALAYTLIWQEYYRDQNLMDEVLEFPTDAAYGKVGWHKFLTIRNRCWKKDEFTSALPWPQRAGQAVSLPVKVSSEISFNEGSPAASLARPVAGHSNPEEGPVALESFGGPAGTQFVTDSNNSPIVVDSSANYEVHSTASMANITELRRAFKVQEWLEAMATGGSRYVEQIMRIFGVRTSDGRLQRPLYLGGTSTPLVMEATPQTSQTVTDGANPSVQGNLAGNGASVSSEFIFKNRFEEHGYIIGIMSIVPRAAYYNGIPRKFQRLDRFDYYWPQFAHIGEQAILKKQVYYQGESADNDVFGYEPRYAEYRFNNDEIHGEFRDTLKMWHLGRNLSPSVQLNRSFVEVSENVADGVMAVNSYNAAPFLCLINNNILASRLISKYGTSHL
ncbi:major capsid protein [Dipodfec virus UOA04_Rod_1032]|nr:major capsid protein [Dipodfec virus UOA04_Rod_1032]